MNKLFTPLKLRSVEFKNRIFVSPMCQYSSNDGMVNDWHLVHLGSRAVGGAAMVMVEATAVSPEGRISPWDSGMWSDKQAEAFKGTTQFIARQDCVPGIQLAHAGRKASTDAPWRGGQALSEAQGGWLPIAPSPLAFNEASPIPQEIAPTDIDQLIDQFVAATNRCLEAGFQVPFAAAIRRQAEIATGSVGLINHAVQAEQIVGTLQADAVLLAREMLRDPYWPLHAARILGRDVTWPHQYARAKKG